MSIGFSPSPETEYDLRKTKNAARKRAAFFASVGPALARGRDNDHSPRNIYPNTTLRCLCHPATHNEIMFKLKTLESYSDDALIEDHIIPWSKGGQNTEENLRTLCFDCNLGKGAKDEVLEI